MEARLKRNILLKAVEALVTIIASFVQLSCITRAYHPTFVGEYQLTLAWLFFISAFSCFGGIVMVSTRDLSQGEEAARIPIFSTAFLLQLAISLPLLCVAYLGFASWNYFNQIFWPLMIGTFALLASLILQTSQALLLSRQEINKVVIASIFSQVISTVALLLVSGTQASLSLLTSAWSLFQFCNGLLLFYYSRAWEWLDFRQVRLAQVRRISREILPVLVMVIATHLYVRIDIAMLDYFCGSEIVAQYGAGYLFLDQLMTLSNFMMGAIFPNFAKSTLQGGFEYQSLYHGILRVFLKYLVPIALIIALFSKSLLQLFFGAEYAEAWVSLSVLMGAALFAWINGPSGTIFISLKKQHIYMWATLISLLVNIIGNLILIPKIGAVGAAVSTVLTEFSICGFCLYWIYQSTGYLPWMPPSPDKTIPHAS